MVIWSSASPRISCLIVTDSVGQTTSSESMGAGQTWPWARGDLMYMSGLFQLGSRSWSCGSYRWLGRAEVHSWECVQGHVGLVDGYSSNSVPSLASAVWGAGWVGGKSLLSLETKPQLCS